MLSKRADNVSASASGSGYVVWLTGPPCSGKTTIARGLERDLHAVGRRVQVLDGDAVRPHLSQDLGYTKRDRELNAFRIAFVAELLARHGVVVLVAAVTPFESTRASVRERVTSYLEVHVDCPLAECERRDVKGMYARARAGALENFTGIAFPYERPLNPELRVPTNDLDVDGAVRRVTSMLLARGLLS